uniref:Uncharacterized protein n=1 Tax=Anguilla anguilla TaxID=7936 RepID=A0A0E9Q324_ANGAN
MALANVSCRKRMIIVGNRRRFHSHLHCS